MNQILTVASQIGPVLRAARRASKLTQADLAPRIGLSQNRLSELERDATKLTAGQLFALLNALGLEIHVQTRNAANASALTKDEW